MIEPSDVRVRSLPARKMPVIVVGWGLVFSVGLAVLVFIVGLAVVDGHAYVRLGSKGNGSWHSLQAAHRGSRPSSASVTQMPRCI